MLRSEHGRVTTPLTAGSIYIYQQGGPTEKHILEACRAYRLPANPSAAIHADVNAGTKPIEVMLVEVQSAM